MTILFVHNDTVGQKQDNSRSVQLEGAGSQASTIRLEEADDVVVANKADGLSRVIGKVHSPLHYKPVSASHEFFMNGSTEAEALDKRSRRRLKDLFGIVLGKISRISTVMQVLIEGAQSFLFYN